MSNLIKKKILLTTAVRLIISPVFVSKESCVRVDEVNRRFVACFQMNPHQLSLLWKQAERMSYWRQRGTTKVIA